MKCKLSNYPPCCVDVWRVNGGIRVEVQLVDVETAGRSIQSYFVMKSIIDLSEVWTFLQQELLSFLYVTLFFNLINNQIKHSYCHFICNRVFVLLSSCPALRLSGRYLTVYFSTFCTFQIFNKNKKSVYKIWFTFRHETSSECKNQFKLAPPQLHINDTII